MKNWDKFHAEFPNARYLDYVEMVESEKRMWWGDIDKCESAIYDWAKGHGKYTDVPLSQIAASFRRACVWAVLVGIENEKDNEATQ